MNRRAHVRTALIVGIGFAAGIGVLGFRDTGAAESRMGLEAYRPEAVEAIDPTREGEIAGHSNAEIISIMEVRAVCREVALFAQSGGKDPDGVEARLRQAGVRAKENGRAESAEASANIDQFVEFAVMRIEETRKSGSTKPVEELVKTECGTQDVTQPVLATNS